MRQSTFSLPSLHDGLPLSVLLVEPDGPPRAVVQIAHGICEHKERYLPFMEYLAARGCLVAIHDHRGHGATARSKEELGYFGPGGADAVTDDILSLTRCLRERCPGLPLVLLGHSMGSLAARALCEEHDHELDGLILTGSPARREEARIALAIFRIARLLLGDKFRSAICWRMVTGRLFKRRKDVSKRAAILEEGLPFTLNGAITVVTLQLRAYALKPPCGRPSLPIRLFSGDRDFYAPKRAQFDDAVERLRAAGYTDVRGRVLNDQRHGFITHPGNDDAFEAIFEDAIAPLIL